MTKFHTFKFVATSYHFRHMFPIRNELELWSKDDKFKRSHQERNGQVFGSQIYWRN